MTAPGGPHPLAEGGRQLAWGGRAQKRQLQRPQKGSPAYGEWSPLEALCKQLRRPPARIPDPLIMFEKALVEARV